MYMRSSMTRFRCMATGRSFSDYVKSKCYNGLYEAAEKYVNENWQSLELDSRRVRRIGEVGMTDAHIERVYVHDLPGMKVSFDVGLELEIEIKEPDRELHAGERRRARHIRRQRQHDDGVPADEPRLLHDGTR